MNDEKKTLLSDWCKFKKAENVAKKKRIEVEGKVEALYGSFEEKSKTFSEEELGFKTVISKSITSSLNQEMYKEVRLNIHEDLRPEKIKFEIDTVGMKWLKENKPEIYREVSDCITSKPGKTGVKVEKI